MLSKYRQLALATGTVMVASLASASVRADAEDAGTTHQLAPVRVSAMALDEDADKLAAPYSVIEEDETFRRSAATLGDTLNGEPGVHVDTFGAGAGRPVIRGQTAPRVSVLSDGAALVDASAISPDHAITAEPLLIRRVEILRGPSTLLYGGGAIGGVVNLLDDKIPTAMPEEGVDGFVALRGNTVANERAGAAGITARASEHLAIHVEGSTRDANDYEVHGFDTLRVDGTFAESHNGSAGLSWITPRGYIGMAYSYRKDKYGLPGHSHEYEGCHAEGGSLHCDDDGHDHGHDHDHEHDHAQAAPWVDLESERVDLRGEYRDPVAGVERVRFRASYTDYAHDEIEGGMVGTRFQNLGYEARVEAEHVPVAGLHGVIGAQYGFSRLTTEGTEAFLPQTETETLGVFILEHYALNEQWHLEAGARQDYQKIATRNDPQDLPHSRMYGTSASAAATWQFLPRYSLSLTAARSQRLPHAQELYARGVHLATNTYECGLFPSALTCGGAADDARIRAETSNNIGLTLRRTMGELTFNIGVFHNRVNDYIYARTLDQFEDFRLIKYTQADAEFTGAEAEATWFLSDQYSVTAFGDTVRATFVDGGNLPRIPAYRAGARVNRYWDTLTGEVEMYHVGSQDDIADYEQRTPGHNMLNASLTWHPAGDDRYSLFVRGTNLLREKIWHHSSFLANNVPEPGRNLSVGVRLTF
ncbi:TonB-dependent receptor domain-containing protein [Isoalcanivorax pacificus W11-5]|uniref:TonB-dependent receptor domain-containing protein n=1 Tax=Isoalcanivorax pacificus W11-5 TaxID=391936 RepID=A0A0B4XSU4_9GAMM|nr:TonB-dependent receptor [Isoalcanivorax pacificus]AJD49488.1 TonB-dependent receptor domain-containing protein [Isoalcanivorax pacificus W11-5]